MEIIAAFAVGLIALCLIGKLVSLPMKMLWKMITNSIVSVCWIYFNQYIFICYVDIIRIILNSMF